MADKQLGHSAQDDGQTLEILRVAAGSRVGRRHYLDLQSSLFDPAESATAVRRLLDEALARLQASSSLLLPRTEQAGARLG